MNGKGSTTKRKGPQYQATEIPQKTLKSLEQEEWAVFTSDTVTQESISSYLSEHGDGYDCRGEIFYDGRRLPVFRVPFRVVMFLKENRHKVPYKFIAYHKRSKNDAWCMWREGQKNAHETLRLLLKGVPIPTPVTPPRPEETRFSSWMKRMAQI